MSPRIGEPYAYEVSMEDKLGMAGDPDTRPARQPLDLVDRLLARGDADSVEAVEAIREWRDLYESAKADAALVAPALTADEHREWLKACHCAEPAPLVPGAKCRKCHRWTVAAVNERTGEMTVIPSNQSEVAIDAAREPQLKQYRPGVGEPMYTDMMNHPYVVPYYLASEVDALVAELRQDLEAAQTQCASAERALNAAYNEADGVLAGLRALIAQMEQIQTYETQEVETLHGLNGHEDWMRSDVVQAGLRKLGELLVPGRPARSQEKTFRWVCVETITAKTFPKQGAYVHQRTRVRFHFGRDEVMGTIVRDDIEEPFRTIIRLDDGRYVLSTECQYSLVVASRPPEES